jgi:glycosyltransferase involved in cell wall biosynthesis
VQPIFIVIHRLGSGGVTNAVLDQAAMFTGAGHRTTIITFEEDASANDRVDELRKLGRLAEEVPVLNIYDWYRNSSTRNKQDAESSTRNYPSIKPAHIADAHPDPDFVEQGTDRHGRYVRHFSIDGEYIAFDRLDDNGTIDHINYFKNRVVYRRDDYIGVSLTKRTLYADNGEPNRIQFMTSDGFCFAQRWVNPESGKGEGVFVSERSTRTVQRFNGLPDWHVAWLQSIVDSEDSLPIVIAETASTIAKVEQLHHDSAVIIGMMHNSHVAAPFTKDAPLRPDYEKSFAELGELDALVVLTEEQKTDMQERLGHHDVFTVVPNAIRLPEEVSRERDPNLVSILSRLAPQKAIQEAIAAFPRVLREVPNARLEIYGRGPSDGDLRSTINRPGLENHVALMGRTEDPLDVIRKSVCTLCTSDWEAFCLSIAESLAAGTPAVSYDCLYGPSTLIRDGVSGYLVQRGDQKALAHRIVGLLTDPDTVEEMGARGRAEMAARLTFSTVMRHWEIAFHHAKRRHDSRLSASGSL